jgi:hypothetical protein
MRWLSPSVRQAERIFRAGFEFAAEAPVIVWFHEKLAAFPDWAKLGCIIAGLLVTLGLRAGHQPVRNEVVQPTPSRKRDAEREPETQPTVQISVDVQASPGACINVLAPVPMRQRRDGHEFVNQVRPASEDVKSSAMPLLGESNCKSSPSRGSGSQVRQRVRKNSRRRRRGRR